MSHNITSIVHDQYTNISSETYIFIHTQSGEEPEEVPKEISNAAARDAASSSTALNSALASNESQNEMASVFGGLAGANAADEHKATLTGMLESMGVSNTASPLGVGAGAVGSAQSSVKEERRKVQEL
jgi:hypothetical protein